MLMLSFLPAPLTPALAAGEGATTAKMAPDIMPVYPPEKQGFLGQDHAYTVTFRGNGEAVVLLKTVFTNTGNTARNSIELRVPRTIPKDIMAYQVTAAPRCIRYAAQPQTEMYMARPPRCEQYEETDFTPYWGNYTYRKAAAELKGDTITVSLPQAVAPERTGSVLLYFRGFGYARKNLAGAFGYTFETLKTDDRIQSVRVAIETDEDLVLKGVKGNVAYRFDDSVAELSAPKAAGLAIASPRLNSLYQQVGSGRVVKSATNLQPLDSYVVKGAFADAAIKLYAGEIVLGFLIVVALGAGATLFTRWAITASTRAAKAEKRPSVTGKTILMVIVSVIASLLIAGLVAGVVALFRSGVLQAMPEMGAIIAVFTVIAAVAVFLFFLLAPAVLVGMKEGAGWGVGTFGLTVLWLIGYLVITVVVTAAMNLGVRREYPIPMMQTQSVEAPIEN